MSNKSGLGNLMQFANIGLVVLVFLVFPPIERGGKLSKSAEVSTLTGSLP